MKHILITGGTSGIGEQAVKHFVAQGYKVFFTGRDPQRIEATVKATGASPLYCDASDFEQIKNLAEQLHKDGIKLDALVLNAGIFYPRPVADESTDNVAIQMRTNFEGPFFTVQQLLPAMNNPSSIVFVSSIAVEKAHPGCAAYGASKAAFEAAAKVMNVELAAQGIRVNSVRPGVTDTQIQRKAGMTEEQIDEMRQSLQGLPVGRILAPTDIVGAIDYLVSDISIAMRASAINIDGGFSL